MEVEESVELSEINMTEIFNRNKNIFIVQSPHTKLEKIEEFLLKNRGNIICSRNSLYYKILPEEKVYLRYGEVIKKRITPPGNYLFYDLNCHHYNKEKITDLCLACEKLTFILANCDAHVLKWVSMDYVIFTDTFLLKEIYNEIFYNCEKDISCDDLHLIVTEIISEGNMLALKIDPESIEFFIVI